MTRSFWLAGMLASLLFSALASAQQVQPRGGEAAIGGYDVVAYFTDGRAVRGDAAHAHTHDGVRWLFASEAHRAAFAASPARYLPAYGGYCAYAMADDRLAPIDPRAFTVVDGTLYLNYSIDIRTRWLADRDAYIRRADASWARRSR
jgi:YHS domain-containing protein